MKRMLINATQEEELRMAMVDGQRLYDLNIELPASERKKANIYKGQITRIEPSLEAAFVNYGSERHGFLPLKEISSEYFVADANSGGKPNIKDVLREGQDIVVQIDKEERGNKGAALTTFVSLAGRFIVLKPNKSRSGGVSRRIVGEDRDLARKSLRDVEVPKDMSVILRTAGIERTSEELTWDMENLLAVWEAIKKVVVQRESPFLIYRESNAVVRALRDYLTNEIGEILIDDEATYKEAREFVEQVMPHNLRKLKAYTDPVPLFTRYQIDSQIESAFAHSVTLPSGGSLVIDHTEALVSIDINSARATKGGDIEATALNTNLESADEIARQLRLRDLGGLVVIDFIDMGPQRNQREVENRLREAVRQDRARVQIGKISRFGLLEMSRQRLRPSLGESSYLVCPRCSGIGNIRSVESLALAILRIIGEEARKERTAKVIAQLPIEVATYLLNEKRDWVQSLESRHDTQVILVANPALETPHYQVRRVRDDQVDLPENVGNSFLLAESESEPEITQTMQDKKPAEIAAITTVVATTPAPPRETPSRATTAGPGLFARIAAFFGGSPDDVAESMRPPKRGRKTPSDNTRRANQRSRKRPASKRQANKKPTQRQKQQPAKKRAKKSAAKGAEHKQDAAGNARKKSTDDNRTSRDSENQRDEQKPSANKRRSRGGRRRRRTQESVDAKEVNQTTVQNGSDDSPKSGTQQKTPRRPRRAQTPASGTETPNSDSSGAKKSAAKSSTPKKRQGRKTESTTESSIPGAESGQAASSPTTGADKAAKIASVVPVLTQVETKKPASVEQASAETAATAPAQSPQQPTNAPKAGDAGALTEVQTTRPKPEKRAANLESKNAFERSNVNESQPELKVVSPSKSAATAANVSKLKPDNKDSKPDKGDGNGERPASTHSTASSNEQQERPMPVETPTSRLLPWDSDDAGSIDKD